MTVSSLGTKGQPIVQDPPSTIADFAAHSAYTALIGNRVVGTASQFNSFTSTYGFSPYPGLEFYQTDTFNTYVWGSSNWVGIKPQTGGVAFASGDFTASGGGFAATRDVAFTTGRFTAAPLVTFGVFTNASQDQHAGVVSVSPTGFTLYYWRANQAATTVGWTATPSDS